MVPEGPRPKNMTYWQAEEVKEWEGPLRRPPSAQNRGVGSGAGSGGKCGDIASADGVGVRSGDGGKWESESEKDEVGLLAHVLMQLGLCVFVFSV